MTEDKDEEIEIDLSKIKDFFRGKKKKRKETEDSTEKDKPRVETQDTDRTEEEKETHTQHHTAAESEEKKEPAKESAPREETSAEKKHEEKELREEDAAKPAEKSDEDGDEELAIDFSKVKKFFKGSGEKRHEEASTPEAEDDEISIDFSKIKNIFSKKKEKEKHAEPHVKEAVHHEAAHKETVEKKKPAHADADDQSEEEFSINVDKIKRFFTSKKESKTEGEASDDEISFDFKKITSFFKGGKRDKKEGRGDSEEISIDVKGLYKKVMKNKHFWIVFLLIGLTMVASVHLRVQSAYLPQTYNWGRSSMENFNRQLVAQQINQQYPNLPNENRQGLVEQELIRIFASDQALVPTNNGVQQVPYQQALESYASSFRQRLQDETGQTYLLAIDPYFWARHARNVLNHGHPGDEIREGVPWDNHMYAPTGRPSDVTFHSYAIAYLTRFLRIFNDDLSLLRVAFFVPVILSALAVIPAFFIGRRLGGNYGGFVAAFITAIHPSFLGRTAGGFSDTDAYNVFFPLLITWLFLEAFETRDIKKKIGLATVAGFSASLYQFTWIGWWYIFDFILAASGIYVLFVLVTNYGLLRKNIVNVMRISAIRNTVIAVVVFVIATSFFSFLFTGAEGLRGIYTTATQPLNFIKIKQVGVSTVWPNVFTTVAEQNTLNLSGIVNQISLGRRFLFLIALFGILVTLIKKDEDGKVDAKYAILLALWFGATIFASGRGIRFLLLLVPAFAIAVGIGLGYLYQKINILVTKEFSISKYISKPVILILLSLILIGPWRSATGTALNEVPNMNDAWWNSLERIRLQSAPDAIINSWWDFGHWFKFIADRKVTFDGTSQNSPQAHWIGRVLLTHDETLAVGILRMLDCSGYRRGTFALDAVDEVIQDTPRAIDVLYEIMVVDDAEARRILARHGFSTEGIDKVVQLTHCEPPENYFITSEDMIGKSGVWGHFGSWDFKRAAVYNKVQESEARNNPRVGISSVQDILSVDEGSAENIYYEALAIGSSQEANNWIAPWPSYASSINGCGNSGPDTVVCPIGQGQVTINTTTFEGNVVSNQGILHPNSIVYPTEDGVEVRRYRNNTVGASITMIPQGGGYQSILAATEQADSMFTRLFFLEGHGLKHFKKFSDERSVFGGRIIVWKVDWEGTEANNVYFREPEPVEEPTEMAHVVEESEEEVVNHTDSDDAENESEDDAVNATDTVENESEEVEGINVTDPIPENGSLNELSNISNTSS